VLYTSESRHRSWRNKQIAQVVSIGGPGGLREWREGARIIEGIALLATPVLSKRLGMLATNRQKQPAASILTPRYDGSTF